jgi:hypothetical protein
MHDRQINLRNVPQKIAHTYTLVANRLYWLLAIQFKKSNNGQVVCVCVRACVSSTTTAVRVSIEFGTGGSACTADVQRI